MFNICPFCKSENITGGSWDSDSASCSQEASCDDCHKDWYECYVPSGFAEMHHPLPDEKTIEPHAAAITAWNKLEEDDPVAEPCAIFYPESGFLNILQCPDDRHDELQGRASDAPHALINDLADLAGLTIKEFTTTL